MVERAGARGVGGGASCLRGLVRVRVDVLAEGVDGGRSCGKTTFSAPGIPRGRLPCAIGVTRARILGASKTGLGATGGESSCRTSRTGRGRISAGLGVSGRGRKGVRAPEEALPGEEGSCGEAGGLHGTNELRREVGAADVDAC